MSEDTRTGAPEPRDYWDWLMRYGVMSMREAVEAYARPPHTQLLNFFFREPGPGAAARRLAEAEDRQRWIGGVKRRLGLVDEVHRCWVWRGGDRFWRWWCQRDHCCYAGEGPLYGSQPDALGDALAHARAYLPPPPEETPVTELDLTAYDTLMGIVRAEQEAFAAAMPGRMTAVADQVNDTLGDWLPEGMRFEWTTEGDER